MQSNDDSNNNISDDGEKPVVIGNARSMIEKLKDAELCYGQNGRLKRIDQIGISSSEVDMYDAEFEENFSDMADGVQFYPEKNGDEKTVSLETLKKLFKMCHNFEYRIHRQGDNSVSLIDGRFESLFPKINIFVNFKQFDVLYPKEDSTSITVGEELLVLREDIAYELITYTKDCFFRKIASKKREGLPHNFFESKINLQKNKLGFFRSLMNYFFGVPKNFSVEIPVEECTPNKIITQDDIIENYILSNKIFRIVDIGI